MPAGSVASRVQQSLIDRLPLVHLGVRRCLRRDRALVSEMRVAVVGQSATSSASALVGLRRERQHVLVVVAVH